jgi:UDP-N-acetylmuramoyl-L-alanyl-D-glutamate--2,6-diaminopimelate ligase
VKLRALLEGTGLRVEGTGDVEVTAIVNDSTKVTEGCLFLAIHGIALDGHDFLAQAVARGARSLVVEDEARVPPGFTGPVVVAPSGREALNQLSSRFFGDPGRSLFCVGVTGTDGKTSVTWMTEAVLAARGLPTGVIGTIDHHLGDHRWPGDTTPPPLVLQERLASFLRLGARAVALEATSQGLSQARVGSVPFDVAVFTNLTRDHLDYHRTFDAYFTAKERLFTEALAASPKSPRYAILNVDTPWGARIRVPPGVTTWTYGARGSGADLDYEVLETGLFRSRFLLRAWGREAELRLPMLGGFHGANALAAIAVGVAAGGDFAEGIEALRRFKGAPGRVQRIVHPGEKAVFLDYAHDPDAFEKVLGTARAAMERERRGARLVTVFGCGGDRDRGKRPLMMRAALRFSDQVIFTADNPRSEEPEAIAQEALAGLETAADRARVQVELDRTKAIHQALDATGDHDVVMILGKGHEDYQIMGKQRFPHSDYAVAAEKLGATEERSTPDGHTDPCKPR